MFLQRNAPSAGSWVVAATGKWATATGSGRPPPGSGPPPRVVGIRHRDVGSAISEDHTSHASARLGVFPIIGAKPRVRNLDVWGVQRCSAAAALPSAPVEWNLRIAGLAQWGQQCCALTPQPPGSPTGRCCVDDHVRPTLTCYLLYSTPAPSTACSPSCLPLPGPPHAAGSVQDRSCPYECAGP